MKTEIYDLSIQNKPKGKGVKNLTFDGGIVAEIPEGVNADSILDAIRDFISDLEWNKKVTISIQNDGDNLGIIVDYYIGDDCEESTTIWFEDYMA